MRKTMTALATMTVGLGIASIAAAAPEGVDAERWNDDKKISEQVKFEPLPGRARAPAMKPAWCDLTSKYKNQVVGKRLGRTMSGSKRTGGFLESRLVDSAELLCAHPNEPDWQKQTGYLVQAWINQTGLGVKAAVASIRARVDQSTWKSQRKQTCSKYVSSSEDSEETKRLNKAMVNTFGCGNWQQFWNNPMRQGKQLEWHVDKSAEFRSEVLKSHWVLECLSKGDDIASGDKHQLLRYARCGVDAQSLSRAKLDAELERERYNGFARTVARDTFARAKATNRAYRTVIDKLVKKDPIYREVFYTAPEKGFRGWVDAYRSNKAAVDAARAYEQKIYGPSKRAMKNCGPALRDNFAKYIRSKKVRTKKAFEAAAHDPIGMVLLAAWWSCETVDGDNYAAALLEKLYRKGRLARGPRHAAYFATVDALNVIRADRMRFSFEHKHLGWHDPVNLGAKLSHLRKKLPLLREAKGVVKKIKRTKDGAKLLFKTEKWREPVVNCSNTNRVHSISAGGRLSYYRDCVDTGRSKLMTHTEKPTLIPSYAAKGIKRGSLVMLRADYPYDNPKLKRPGFPLAVYKSKKAKKLMAYYGIPL